jgi:single-strand DNA-binding protein
MSDLNSVSIVGRLTKAPEMKYTKTGTAVTAFSLANNKTFNYEGTKKETVSYFKCNAWGGLGEMIAKHCQKGARVGVHGRLNENRYEDADGKWHSRIEIIVDEFQFLDSRKSDNSNDTPADQSNISGIGETVNDVPSFDEV